MAAESLTVRSTLDMSLPFAQAEFDSPPFRLQLQRSGTHPEGRGPGHHRNPGRDRRRQARSRVSTAPTMLPGWGLDSEGHGEAPSFDISESLTLLGSFQYHWATFAGEGDLNLRNDLAHPTSFQDQADGKGIPHHARR